MEACYVYLLVDADPVDPSKDEVFYVGKGTGARALDHLSDAQTALTAGSADQAGDQLNAAEKADGEAGASPALDTSSLGEKVKRIVSIFEAGRHVRIDVLRSGLSTKQAHLVESAAIDLLGRQNLTNVVSGQESFRLPATALRTIERADATDLTHHAVMVGVAGAWGGSAPLSGLLDANEDVIWENARHTWPVDGTWVERLRSLARGGEPALLIAVGIHNPLWGGLVLGVWEIEDLARDAYRRADDRWQFLRPTTVTPRLLAAREQYLGKRLIGVRQQPGVVYSDSLKSHPW